MSRIKNWLNENYLATWIVFACALFSFGWALYLLQEGDLIGFRQQTIIAIGLLILFRLSRGKKRPSPGNEQRRV